MDLWKRVMEKATMLQRQGVIVQMSWTRAHQTEAQMRAGTISFRDWRGNEWADDVAKKGARRDALAVQTVQHYFKELAISVGWLRWCIFCA